MQQRNEIWYRQAVVRSSSSRYGNEESCLTAAFLLLILRFICSFGCLAYRIDKFHRLLLENLVFIWPYLPLFLQIYLIFQKTTKMSHVFLIANLVTNRGARVLEGSQKCGFIDSF